MIHIALKTEFSFKKSFLHVKDIHKHVVNGYVGIADLNSTFGHVPLQKEAEKHGFKPIFGVRLHVLKDGSEQRVCNTSWIFIAKNDRGLKELYGLVSKAFDQFYYIPRLFESDVLEVSENVFVIATHESEVTEGDFQAIGQGYSAMSTEDTIAIDNNNYPRVQDSEIYELLAGARKNGSGYSHFFEDCTYPQHIMSLDEWLAEYEDKSAVGRTYKVAKECTARIPEAEMVTWTGSHDLIATMDMDKVKNWTPEYDSRLACEINLIREKGYADYFLITADLIMHCKKKMLVGPARGCFLPDQIVKTAKGGTEIQNIAIGDVLVDAYGDYQICVDTFKYDCDEEILDIEFEDGTIVSCTKDHKILTPTGWLRADELDIESEVISNE